MTHSISDTDLEAMERVAYSEPESQEKDFLAQTILCIRSLKHQLVDPNYLYAGGRICRAAIVCRNEEINQLRKDLKNAKFDSGISSPDLKLLMPE